MEGRLCNKKWLVIVCMVALPIAMERKVEGAKLTQLETNCQSLCQTSDDACLIDCVMENNIDDTEHTKLRKKRSPQQTGNFDFSKVVILQPGQTPPPGLIMPTGDPPHLPDQRQKGCRGANPKDATADYPGLVQNLQTECEPATAFSPQRVVVKWSLPEKFRTHLVTGYEIFYHIQKDYEIDPANLSCFYTSNNVRSYSFDMTIKNDEHLYLMVTPLPTYKGLKSPFVLVSCLENTTGRVQPVQKKSPLKKSPLDIALMIGSITGAICFLLFLALVAKLLTSTAIPFGCRNNKEENGHSKPDDPKVDPGYEEAGFERQLTRDTILRDSMLSFRSDCSLQTKVCAQDNVKVETFQKPKVYISYYPDSEKFKNSLLSLMARLRTRHGVDVVFDELDKRSIDKLGTAGWCNSKLTKCDKVMMIISPKYLEALRLIEKDEKSSSLDCYYMRKVCLETHYINSRLFTENQRGSALVLLLAGTEESQLPVFWSSRSVYDWPVVDTDSERRLVCCLNEIEDFVL